MYVSSGMSRDSTWVIAFRKSSEEYRQVRIEEVVPDTRAATVRGTERWVKEEILENLDVEPTLVWEGGLGLP